MNSSTTDLRRLRLFRALAEEPSYISPGLDPRPKRVSLLNPKWANLEEVLKLRRGRTNLLLSLHQILL